MAIRITLTVVGGVRQWHDKLKYYQSQVNSQYSPTRQQTHEPSINDYSCI